MINRFIYGVDQLSRMVGHVFAWCILILTMGTSYEVFVRYVLNNPTSWAFDSSYRATKRLPRMPAMHIPG